MYGGSGAVPLTRQPHHGGLITVCYTPLPLAPIFYIISGLATDHASRHGISGCGDPA
jgi:hypothetical protein